MILNKDKMKKTIKDNIAVIGQSLIIISIILSGIFFINNLFIKFDRLEAQTKSNCSKIEQVESRLEQYPSVDQIEMQYIFINQSLDEIKAAILRCQEYSQELQKQIYEAINKNK